ncbi:UNVERIFIED_CONTAM: hypothetical protein NCL1_40275 [Trichonephila clavipes]
MQFANADDVLTAFHIKIELMSSVKFKTAIQSSDQTGSKKVIICYEDIISDIFSCYSKLSKSGSQSVYLRHVDLNSAGTYRCEVSAEAPEFQTVAAEKKMVVFVN